MKSLLKPPWAAFFKFFIRDQEVIANCKSFCFVACPSLDFSIWSIQSNLPCSGWHISPKRYSPPQQGSVLSFPLLANRKFTFVNLILKKWLWEILRDYDSDMSHRWGFIPEILGFKLHMFTCVCVCVFSVCLQGRGREGHSCLKSLLGQRITWGLPGHYTHTSAHAAHEGSVVYSRALGSEFTGLKLHFSTWQKRNRVQWFGC